MCSEVPFLGPRAGELREHAGHGVPVHIEQQLIDRLGRQVDGVGSDGVVCCSQSIDRGLDVPPARPAPTSGCSPRPTVR